MTPVEIVESIDASQWSQNQLTALLAKFPTTTQLNAIQYSLGYADPTTQRRVLGWANQVIDREPRRLEELLSGLRDYTEPDGYEDEWGDWVETEPGEDYLPERYAETLLDELYNYAYQQLIDYTRNQMGLITSSQARREAQEREPLEHAVSQLLNASPSNLAGLPDETIEQINAKIAEALNTLDEVA